MVLESERRGQSSLAFELQKKKKEREGMWHLTDSMYQYHLKKKIQSFVCKF